MFKKMLFGAALTAFAAAPAFAGPIGGGGMHTGGSHGYTGGSHGNHSGGDKGGKYGHNGGWGDHSPGYASHHGDSYGHSTGGHHVYNGSPGNKGDHGSTHAGGNNTNANTNTNSSSSLAIAGSSSGASATVNANGLGTGGNSGNSTITVFAPVVVVSSTENVEQTVVRERHHALQCGSGQVMVHGKCALRRYNSKDGGAVGAAKPANDSAASAKLLKPAPKAPKMIDVSNKSEL